MSGKNCDLDGKVKEFDAEAQLKEVGNTVRKMWDNNSGDECQGYILEVMDEVRIEYLDGLYGEDEYMAQMRILKSLREQTFEMFE